MRLDAHRCSPQLARCGRRCRHSARRCGDRPRPGRRSTATPAPRWRRSRRTARCVAWFATPSTKACNGVHVLSLGNGAAAHDCRYRARAQNVTCRWPRPQPPVSLALARLGRCCGRCAAAAPLPFDYVLGVTVDVGQRASAASRRSRTRSTAPGLWLGGIAGDESHARLRRHVRRLRGRGRLPRGHRAVHPEDRGRRRLPDGRPDGSRS